MKLLQKTKPEIFFLFTGLFFGTFILLITPPFQAPDETNHFFRAWQISEGQLIGNKTNDRVGGSIPCEIVAFSQKFVGLRHNQNIKTSRSEILDARNVQSSCDTTIFVDFPNTGIYTPISYAPQAIIIAALRCTNCGAFWIFYATRLVTLLTWMIVIYYAISLLPAFKWLFTLLALLPMSLFANMAISADMVTNALAFLTITYILHCAFSAETFTRKNGIVISILTILLTSAKLVYAPILLLVFIVPASKFNSRKHFYRQVTFILMLSAIVAYGWSAVIGMLYTPYADYNPLYRNGIDLMPDANVSGQVKYIFSHDTYILRVFLRSLKESSEMYLPGYIGTFGWLDTHLSNWIIIAAYSVLLFVTIAEDNSSVRFTSRSRIILFAALFSLLATVIISQLLSWEFVGSGRVIVLQGRYFIPVFPLAFLLIASFSNLKLQFAKVCVLVAAPLIAGIAIYSVYNRYYVDPVNETITVQCGAEEVYKYDFFSTNHDAIKLEGGGVQSKNRLRTGNYSFELSSAKPYAGAYHFYNIQKGDSIQAEVWRFGSNATITLALDSVLISSIDGEQGADGWQKVVLNYKFNHSPQSSPATIFLWSQGDSTTYFDDFEFHYYKSGSE